MFVFNVLIFTLVLYYFIITLVLNVITQSSLGYMLLKSINRLCEELSNVRY